MNSKLQAAIKRADLMSIIRSFFTEKGVLEVETPLLSRASGMDPWIDVFETQNFVDGVEINQIKKQSLYLNTSPEFHMKRLLCEGFPDCFQISKAFRCGETGPRHQWEFTILEWYRLGYDSISLQAEVEQLLVVIGFSLPALRITWRELYQNYCHFDPIHVSIDDLEKFTEAHNLAPLNRSESENCFEFKESLLDYILVSIIEPKLGFEGPLWVEKYPAHQAALAKTWIDDQGLAWAHRFELYIEGVELANGYWELTDAQDQRSRFKSDQTKRLELAKRPLKIDEEFLSALDEGLPDCSGIAIGLDRLLMLKTQSSVIQDVLLFHNDNC